MSVLTKCDIDRIADLLAEGSLKNAQEIARLLTIELGEQRDIHKGHTVRGQSLQPYLNLLGTIVGRLSRFP